jgi:hypothetical protein
MAHDMPSLNDARRIVRISMVLDEIRFMAKMYKDNTVDQIRTHLSDQEFYVCGGKAVTAREYSFYRQLVYAKRDADVYAKRMTFPSATAAKTAISLYKFYDTDDEMVGDASKMGRDPGMQKIAFVLRRFRKFARKQKTLASATARIAFLNERLTKDEFVRCGGHKTVSSTIIHPFYRQVVLAKRDMETILEHGRFPKSKRMDVPLSISTDDEGNPIDEEDVDLIDGDATEGKALHNEDETDDIFA